MLSTPLYLASQPDVQAIPAPLFSVAFNTPDSLNLTNFYQSTDYPSMT